jgi:hypothetical protein
VRQRVIGEPPNLIHNLALKRAEIGRLLPINEDKMNELVLANRAADWRRLKMLVLDSVSSPITKRVYNLGLDEFFEWFGREPRSGFNKATVSTWRVALEARGLGSISINVRITAVRKLAVEAADNGLLAPEVRHLPRLTRESRFSVLSIKCWLPFTRYLEWGPGC